MTTIMRVKFENGLLRPLHPLDWQEGEEHTVAVQYDVLPTLFPTDPPDPQRSAQILAEIAAMPLETTGRLFSNREHDRILYGGSEGGR